MSQLVLKVISNLGHIGSSQATANHLDSLPKAAGKFNFLNGVTIKRKSKDSDPNVNKGGKVDTKNNTSVVSLTVEATPEEAALIAYQLSSIMENSGSGSDKYIAKKANFDTCKSKVLQSFNAKSYDELSNEQRIEYSRQMIDLKAPFYYYQTVIHIKYDGKSTVFTKSYRTLQRVKYDEAWLQAQINKAVKLSSKYEVITRTENKDSSSTLPGSSTSFNGMGTIPNQGGATSGSD